MKSLRVLLFSGAGKLHFIEAAEAMLESRLDVRMCAGINGSNWPRWLLDAVGAMVGRKQLAKRIAARSGSGGRLSACLEGNAIGEAAVLLASQINMRFTPVSGVCESIGWGVSGWLGRRLLGNCDLLHLRSGSGGGGLLECARRRGMPVVVDHSIAHPVEIERLLRPVVEKYNIIQPISGNNVFWRRVVADCEGADLVVVNSDFVRNTFVANGWHPKKLVVNYWGVRKDFIGIKNSWAVGKPVQLLFTGTFGARKGAHVLLEALILLNRTSLR